MHKLPLASLALAASVGLARTALAEPITIAGSGSLGGFITRIDEPFSQTLGAPEALEAAFPAGQPFSATLTYDPTRVTYDASNGQPDQSHFFGPPTSMTLHVAGHTVVPDASVTSPYSSFLVILINDTGIWGFDSLMAGFQPALVDGSSTIAGFHLDSAHISLDDTEGLTLSSNAIPTQICLAEWPRLVLGMWFSDGSPARYHLGGYGTPDRSIDSDSDGILDGEELLLQGTLPSLDPCDADSDDDMLPDGSELAAGTSPVAADTDGDGMEDGVDPDPLQPDVTVDELADLVYDAATGVLEIPEAAFDGPNANAERGRRNALGNRLQAAANAIESGDLEEALAILDHVRELIDGLPAPPDVMDDGADKDDLLAEVDALIALLEGQLAG
jgi:hypothetical protein